MLSSPTTVTIDAVPHSLNRINQDNFGAYYRKITTGAQYDLQLRHSTENSKLGAPKIDRHNVDLKYTTFDAEGKPTVYQVYAVLRTPQGADPTIIEKLSAGFNAWLTANDGAIIGWES